MIFHELTIRCTLEQVLRDIRGVDNVEEEFNDIKAAVERARLVVNPWRTILKPSYAPQLFVAITATLFQQVPLAVHAVSKAKVLFELAETVQISVRYHCKAQISMQMVRWHLTKL